MSRTGLVWGVVAVAVLAIGVFWFMGQPTQPTDVTVNTSETGGEVSGGNVTGTGTNTAGTATGTATGGVSGSVNAGVNTAPMTATITYNGTSFSPSSVTIKRGGTVTWRNESSGNMWVASAQHP